MAKRNPSSWNGKGWQKSSKSEFRMPSNGETPCEKQEPVNKLRKKLYGNQEQQRGDSNPNDQSFGRIARPDQPYQYSNGIRKYNPFDYRPMGLGEDQQGSSFDKTLANRPTELDRKTLSPLEYQLSRYAEQNCLTKHEGRAWVYTPESLSHYFSQWKRYQKSLSLQPQAVVVDPLGDSVYRFFSPGSPYGYWDVKVGTLIEGAASLEAPARLIEFCASPIVVNATVEPVTETATWTQIAGEAVPFAQFNRGELLEIYRTGESGPFIFELTLPGEVNPLTVTTIVETSPRDFPETGFGQDFRYIPSVASNPVKIAFTVSGCGVTSKQNNTSDITFDPPGNNNTYITSYELQRFDIGLSDWITLQTSPQIPRQFNSIPGGVELRILTNFNVASRIFQSISERFTFDENTVDVAASDCSKGYGFYGNTPTLTRFFGSIKIQDPDDVIGYGFRGAEPSITKFTGVAKDNTDATAVGYGLASKGTFTRTDFGGVIIG